MGFSRISTVASFTKLMVGVRMNPIKYKTQDIKMSRFKNRLSYEDSMLNLGMEVAESINYANSLNCLDVYKGYLDKRKYNIFYYNEKFIEKCMYRLKLDGIWYRKADNPIQAWFVNSYQKGIFNEIYNDISKGVKKDETTNIEEIDRQISERVRDTDSSSSSNINGSSSDIDDMTKEVDKLLYPDEK